MKSAALLVLLATPVLAETPLPLVPLGLAPSTPSSSASYYTAPDDSTYGSDGSAAVRMGDAIYVSPQAGQSGTVYIESGGNYYGSDGSAVTNMGGFTTYSAPAD